MTDPRPEVDALPIDRLRAHLTYAHSFCGQCQQFAAILARPAPPSEVERLRALSEAATPGPYAFNGYPFTLSGADAEFAIAAANYVRAALTASTEPSAD